MIVLDKRRHNGVTFRCLNIGDTFLNPQGELCLKIAPLWDEDEECFNTVLLKTGIVSYNSDYEVVSQVAATVTYTEIN